MPERAGGKEQPFDVQRDLSPTDWRNMRAQLKELYKKHTPGSAAVANSYVHLAASMKILNPREIIHFPKQGKMRQTLEFDLERHKRSGDWSEFLNITEQMKIIDPSFFIRTKKEDRESISELWSELGSNIEQVGILADAHVFYPEGRKRWSIDTWQEIYKAWDTYDNGDFHPPDLLSSLRIACPEHYIPPSGKDWADYRERLDGFRKDIAKGQFAGEQIWRFADIAAELRILAAEEVYVDDKGLHIIGQIGGGSIEKDASVPPAASQI